MTRNSSPEFQVKMSYDAQVRSEEVARRGRYEVLTAEHMAAL